MCYNDLTTQEKRVALGIARGRTCKEIANNMFLATSTVQTHVKKIKEKLHCHTDTAISRVVCEHHLKTVDPAQRYFNLLKLNLIKL